jgi:hypothetical protein
VGAHSAWEPHHAKAFERLSTKDELRRTTDDVIDQRPQWKEALRAAVDQFKVVCRSAPRICRTRRQIRYVASHMEDGRRLTNCQSAKNDGRLLFQRAAEGKRGAEALLAIGDAYIDEMVTDPIRLPGQMHVYVASSDPETARSFASATATSSPTPSRSRASPRADLELPPHRHAAERPRLNAGAGGAEHWTATLLEGCRRTCRGLSA